MSSKTARKSMSAAQAAAPDKVKLTGEAAIREIRNLRAGKLAVGNMEFVDALLAEYDKLAARLAVRLAEEREVPYGEMRLA